jgi:hypothetical protein
LTHRSAHEAKPGDSDEQFLYRTRKKALGPFKQALWEAAGTPEILETQRAKFQSLFTQLGVGGSRALVERYVTQAADPLPPAPADLLR